MRLRFNHAQRYTLPVERQLKERLIGAGVLIAIAVLLVPELFSGPRSHDAAAVVDTTDAGSAASATNQVKTWQVNLQSAAKATSSESATAVEPPAPAPNAETSEASSASTSASSSSAASAAQSSVMSEVPVAAPVPASSSASSISSAKPVPPPPKPATLSKWQVQVGSFSTEARARQIAGQLKSAGQSATVSALRSGAKTLYRVRIGAGDSREAAQAVLKKLSASYPGAAIVPPGK